LRWTTPQHHDSQGGDPERVRRYGTLHGAANLSDDVVAWPTPAAQDTRSGEAGTATLAANARPLNEVASHWPTPGATVVNDGETLESRSARRGRNLAKHVNGNGMGTPLTIAAIAFRSSPPAPPTAPPGPPSSPPGPTSPPLWPTAVQEDSQVTGWRPNKDASGQSLNATAQLWPTPHGGANTDHTGGRGGPGGELGMVAVHPEMIEGGRVRLGIGKNVPTGEKRRLNPRFVAWLMGLPPGWLDALSSCGRGEMASYRCRLRTLLRCLLGDSASTSAAD
jgi:hypothetical protein